MLENDELMVIDTFIEQALRPTLQSLHEESDQAVVLRVYVVSDSKLREIRFVSVGATLGDVGPEATGEVRVRFKKRFEPGRHSFVAQALIKGLARNSGFSGFSLRGAMVVSSPAPSMNLTSCTYTYNMHEWAKELEVP